ncbi:NYN domain-containing protein [Leifsonia bigeumensis]|uniref:NYN domain-containing protein n=1 Tax=Leifsonella bigeumensis TaxID=433643 RepID=A0ABP7FIQ3_9MICO
MPEPTEGRVAVYIDFDNIVISRYDQVHGRGHFKRDGAREYVVTAAGRKSEEGARVEQARVDLGAVLDYASSFGTVAISRAYADWSVPVNANYRDQLVGRAVELVQMFPTVQSMKNGADIRMSVDVVEDLFRLPELTHVVIVSGDSDFIALAQRCRRLGRYVVGIGVAGGTSKALNAACNEYKDYDGLPGLDVSEAEGAEAEAARTDVAGTDAARTDAAPTDAAETAAGVASASATTTAGKGRQPARKAGTAATPAASGAGTAKPADQRAATSLLRRALELGQSKDDVDWVASSGVKTQMLRMDPTFQEKLLGYKTFTDFLRSRGNVIELKEDGQLRFVRLRGAREAGS